MHPCCMACFSILVAGDGTTIDEPFPGEMETSCASRRINDYFVLMGHTRDALYIQLIITYVLVPHLFAES